MDIKEKNIRLLIILLLLIVLGGGYYLLQKDRQIIDEPYLKAPQDNPQGNINIENPNNAVKDSESIEFDDSALNNTKLPGNFKIPNLDRQVSDDVPENIKTSIKEIQNNLKENPNNLSPWLELANLYKSAGDYEGAEEALIFATEIRPDDWIAYHNLADLYGYYIVDKEKAEKYILLTIEKAPDKPQVYVKAYEIYKDVIGNTEPMKEIIKNGLKVIPGDETLLSIKKILE